MTRPCWDCYWAERVEHLAVMSTCSTRQVGAVAVIGKHVIAEGFNGTLSGRTHCEDGGCERCATSVSGKALERCVCVHAEQNLVAHCARRGIALAGASVYVSTLPCVDCAKLLLASGVTRIHYQSDYPSARPLLEQLGCVFTVKVADTQLRLLAAAAAQVLPFSCYCAA